MIVVALPKSGKSNKMDEDIKKQYSNARIDVNNDSVCSSILNEAIQDMVMIEGLPKVLTQHLVVTYEDRLKIVYNECLVDRTRKGSWITPFSLFLTILVVLLTSTFKTIFGVSPDIFLGMAIVLCIIFLVWTIIEIVKAKKKPEMTFKDFLEKIKLE